MCFTSDFLLYRIERMSGRIESAIVPIVIVGRNGVHRLAGNGIVISPNAVVTCRHVIEKSHSILCGTRVCHARRVRTSRDWDLGCLFFDALPGVKPVPLYRASKVSGLPLSATGFQQDDRGLRLDRIPELTVRIQQKSRRALQAVQLNGGAPSGMSGSPVVVSAGGNQFAVGMLWLGQEQAATSRMIAADTIAAFLAEPPVAGFAIKDLPDVAPGCLRIPSRKWNAKIHGPAALLVAENEVVPFKGRERELAGIDAWARGSHRFGIRVYHERGGVGKTRLAIEACKRLAKKKFQSGFLARDASAEQVFQLLAGAADAEAAGLFIVIDYAETSPDALRNVIAASSDFPHIRVRLMLLARGVGDWWETARQTGEGVGDVLMGPATEDPIRLGPVGVSPEFREEEFRRAATAFARRLGRELPDGASPDLSAPIFERALLLHACALFAVLDIPFRKTRTSTADPFLEALWGRESRFIRRMVESRGLRSTLNKAAAMTLGAITAIRGVDDIDDTVSMILAMPSLRGTNELDAREMAELLHGVYGGSRWIDPLEPDILGEYVFDRLFSRRPADASAILSR